MARKKSTNKKRTRPNHTSNTSVTIGLTFSRKDKYGYYSKEITDTKTRKVYVCYKTWNPVTMQGSKILSTPTLINGKYYSNCRYLRTKKKISLVPLIICFIITIIIILSIIYYNLNY